MLTLADLCRDNEAQIQNEVESIRHSIKRTVCFYDTVRLCRQDPELRSLARIVRQFPKLNQSLIVRNP